MSEILGIGIDIIEIGRIRESIEKHGSHFIKRLFTDKEESYCFQFQDPVPHFAGRFAAKEAIAKALSTGFGKELQFLDLEIVPDAKGKPYLIGSEKFLKTFHNPSILLSISHSKEYGTAVAIYCS